ncbi:hypothetical protein CesoFtcFv8_013908 [Champsocephalus esox]|uniref:Uncharacterized protein n=2 Tax=Champsocephalus TaxID=52236 RepID=A0AAN8DF19_CHAGU|nr:hypothetical protein CesoFtcFv8_013908 [Champsocephalus esox]KAK5920915.1 hypothetical protein CgunFtcFv8_024666 [Champsocephalus gunnari]
MPCESAVRTSLGGVALQSISKCRTRNRLRFTQGGGEWRTQVNRSGVKVFFSTEKHTSVPLKRILQRGSRKQRQVVSQSEVVCVTSQ